MGSTLCRCAPHSSSSLMMHTVVDSVYERARERREQTKFDDLLLLCVWATTAWYVAIRLLPARGRSLAAIRQLLCVWATAWYVAISFLPQRGDVLWQLLDQLLCVWATAWYVAICLLPARGRSLAAIRQLLACRVPELSIIPCATRPDWKQKKTIIIPASTAVLPRTFVKALVATFMWLDACVSTAILL